MPGSGPYSLLIHHTLPSKLQADIFFDRKLYASKLEEFNINRAPGANRKFQLHFTREIN